MELKSVIADVSELASSGDADVEIDADHGGDAYEVAIGGEHRCTVAPASPQALLNIT